MADHSDEKLRQVAAKMREVFWAEYGDPESWSKQEMDDAVRSLFTLHTAEMVEVVARFKSPELDLIETCTEVVKMFCASNRDQIAEITGQGDPLAYIRTHHHH